MATLAQTTGFLRVLGDPNRVRLLVLLQDEELTVAELTRITRLTQSRVSSHLGKLKEAGLVQDRRAGTAAFYRSEPAVMPDEARLFWDQLRQTAHDPLFEQDRAQKDELLAERGGGAPPSDAVAGRIERHYSPGRTWEAALRGLLGLVRLGNVLDIASGDCAIAELVAPRSRRVTCVDLSPRVLSTGRDRMRALGHVGFARGDMHRLPFPDASFDQVLALACLTYATDPARVVAEAARVLRPGGSLVAATLLRHGQCEPRERYNHLRDGFETEELRALVSDAGLSVELCAVTSRERRAPHYQVITVHACKGHR